MQSELSLQSARHLTTYDLRKARRFSPGKKPIKYPNYKKQQKLVNYIYLVMPGESL